MVVCVVNRGLLQRGSYFRRKNLAEAKVCNKRLVVVAQKDVVLCTDGTVRDRSRSIHDELCNAVFPYRFEITVDDVEPVKVLKPLGNLAHL